MSEVIPQTISLTFVVLDDANNAIPIAVGDRFYEKLEQQFGDFKGKRLISHAGINNPDLQKQPGRYQIETVGLTAEPGTTIGGIRILPDIGTTDLPRLTNRRLRYGQ